MSRRAPDAIVVHGARQNNLKNLSLELPLNELIVVTGVSGSGKSSLVFDTLYAEGQRRYVETFSPYARQFLERMDKPKVDLIEGIPPAIAIDQVNPVRTSRSTVGTMTEINDHLKLLFARAATLYCRVCQQPVRRDDAASIAAALLAPAAALGDPRLLICFPVPVPPSMPSAKIRAELERQGYSRIHSEEPALLTVIQDRLRLGASEPARLIQALEAALRAGHGRLSIHAVDGAGVELRSWRFSADLHCAQCDLHYQDATPALFSFNSPLGACECCRGFGRVIGIDYKLVVPDESKSLAEGAVRPFQTPSFKECQDDLMRYARRRGIDVKAPWRTLPPEARQWVTEGEGPWNKKVWYGIQRFFSWLESKAYKMHIRVLLSKYRSYTECPQCHGARLKPDALLWRLPPAEASAARGANIHELMLLPIERCRDYFAHLALAPALGEALDLVLKELRSRLGYLCDVGLAYLTLDRQSRTLSGGEVQRINLTTALGTSLVNTLFVLDEPSIGLHPRDMGRVISVMHRLRDAGNSLLVVEHDPQMMREADRILDLGPGAGEHGGEIVSYAAPAALMRDARSITGAWLAGRRRQPPLRASSAALPAAGSLKLEGVSAHNLKDITLEVPLRRLVCLTGVSGSGKSTLVQEVLYPAIQQAKGKSSATPLAFRGLLGAEQIDEVVLIDQAQIGRTTRSNPVSYVGAFDEIRALFAKTPDARLRRYSAGTFSFNGGTGRCPVCSGNGFEHIEMQFLSDVYLRCGECQGRRYRRETLEVRLAGAGGRDANIADVLDMTVTGAIEFFADRPRVLQRLKPLADVGLDYLRLGQPVPTLSGGEAQRLKLAGHLAEAALAPRRRAGTAQPATRGKLLLFDEPTTGLHFEDIARLIGALRLLLEAGHSLLIIEHNLDLIRAADWLIELGPEGGERGGQIIASGTPDALAALGHSPTGQALAEAVTFEPVAARVAEPTAQLRRRAPAAQISVRGAREHNLCNIDVDVPRDKFTVITGVSGSGKSTLAFDILFGEGQRRYLESLNAYARQFVQPAARPDLDSITGIPPTVAIEQRTSRGGLRSTVATLTEIYHFLRLLYVRVGTQYCPDCNVAITPQSAEAIAAQLLRQHRRQKVQLLAPLIARRKGIYTDLARWAAARGVKQLRVDGEFVPTEPFPRLKRFVEHTIEMPVAELVIAENQASALHTAIHSALDAGQGLLHVLTPSGRVAVYSSRRSCPSCGRGFAEPDPRLLSFNSSAGWCTHCRGTGLEGLELDEEQSGEEERWMEPETDARTSCSQCAGQRLNPVALSLKVAGRSISALTALSVSHMQRALERLKLDARSLEIGRDALVEMRSRLDFLNRVGLGYLALDRPAPTLSGGEAQRIRLAAQLGSNLRGVCYVLDEPTIGLHPRDNAVLLDALEALAAARNTLVVVEHDEDTIRRADHVIDLGPGAGVRGGQVIAAGTAVSLQRSSSSVTGRYLRQPLMHPALPRRPVLGATPKLALGGINLHNLKNLDLKIPLHRLVVITGVSGSGKSSLARDVIYRNLHAAVADPRRRPALVGLKRLAGQQLIDRVLEVDQTPIGRTPRSCPATYIGFWDDIRRLFAESDEARVRGYSASRFSFNAGTGRCSDCEGQGQRTIEMSFLPDVKVRCDTCGGQRFNQATLEVRWRDRTISDVLEMNVETATEFFAAHPRIHRPLRLLGDVGLGYLTLGQPSPTLSGGEAQRIKLVSELSRLGGGVRLRPLRNHTLFVLDEPTVGLHMADVEKLSAVLHQLVDAGHSVLIVEHNLDIMAEADWIIDLGPEAGDQGGRLVAQGAPAQIAQRAGRSHTGAALATFLGTRTLKSPRTALAS
jgi:excinuclease ABC subunit A